jgi:hypothetical protein
MYYNTGTARPGRQTSQTDHPDCGPWQSRLEKRLGQVFSIRKRVTGISPLVILRKFLFEIRRLENETSTAERLEGSNSKVSIDGHSACQERRKASRKGRFFAWSKV